MATTTTEASEISSVRRSPSLNVVPPADSQPAPAPQPPAKKPGVAKYVLPALIAAAAVGGSIVYAMGRGTESTDDAQVEGRVASVAARVPGQIKRVLVQDNQLVRAGDVLVELDNEDFLARQAAAHADVAAAKASLHSAQANLGLTEKTTHSNVLMARGGLRQASALEGTTSASIEQSRADLDAADSKKALAQIEFDRSEGLYDSGVVAKAEYDRAKSALEQADAAVAQAHARLAGAQANLANSSGTLEAARGKMVAAESGPEQVEAARAQVELASAKVLQAEAAARQADLNVGYTEVRAETSGIVSRRTVELGQLVSPDRPLLAIVALDDTWVVANFKEDQVAHMHPGQGVEVKVDAYSGRRFMGHVDSLAGGTGSRFALLPPDNASGNFTKVTQRVPVLIRLDPTGDFTLRPGMSAVATVNTQR